MIVSVDDDASARHLEKQFLEMDNTSIVVDDRFLDAPHELLAQGD